MYFFFISPFRCRYILLYFFVYRFSIFSLLFYMIRCYFLLLCCVIIRFWKPCTYDWLHLGHYAYTRTAMKCKRRCRCERVCAPGRWLLRGVFSLKYRGNVGRIWFLANIYLQVKISFLEMVNYLQIFNSYYYMSIILSIHCDIVFKQVSIASHYLVMWVVFLYCLLLSLTQNVVKILCFVYVFAHWSI